MSLRHYCDALKHPEAMKDLKKKAKGADVMDNVLLPGLLPPGGRPHKRGELLLRPPQSGALLHRPRQHGVPPRLPRLFGNQLHRLRLRGRQSPPEAQALGAARWEQPRERPPPWEEKGWPRRAWSQ